MSMSDLIALLHSVAWPVATLVIVILLRHQINTLLGRVREIAGPGSLKVAFDKKEVEEIVEEAKRGDTSTKALARRLEQSVTVFDNREARILRALLDDDGRAIYNYQTDYYRAALDSLIKQGYVQKAGKGFALIAQGKQKTKEYLLSVLDRIDTLK